MSEKPLDPLVANVVIGERKGKGRGEGRISYQPLLNFAMTYLVCMHGASYLPHL